MSLSFLGGLTKANAAFGNLKQTLLHAREFAVKEKEMFLDLAPALDIAIADIDAKLALLDAPMSPDALANLAVVILPEVMNVLRGHLQPTPHAGDAI